jgi:hypothetical protein
MADRQKKASEAEQMQRDGFVLNLYPDKAVSADEEMALAGIL